MGAVSLVVPGRSDRSTVFTQNNKAQCCLCTEFKPAPGLSLGSIHSVLPAAEKLTHTKRYIMYSRTNGWVMHTLPEKPKGYFNPRLLAEEMLPLT